MLKNPVEFSRTVFFLKIYFIIIILFLGRATRWRLLTLIYII